MFIFNSFVVVGDNPYVSVHNKVLELTDRLEPTV